MTALPTMDRTAGLGGSDMPVLLRLVSYKDPLDLYLEKVGEAPSFEGNEATELGSAFEDQVARLYSKRTGNRVRRNNRTLVHPDHPWATAHIDRDIVGQPKILEIKCSSADGWGEPGTDQVPFHVLPQVHHYLGITGAEACDVAALLWGGYGPPRLQVYTVPRDEEMLGILLEEGERFWSEHVVPRIPPPPESSAAANRRWRQATTGKSVPATSRTIPLVAELEACKAEAKLLSDRRDAVELELKTAIEDAEAIVDEQGKPLVTWKLQTSKRFDVKQFRQVHPDLHDEFLAESAYRVLRLTKKARERAADESPNP